MNTISQTVQALDEVDRVRANTPSSVNVEINREPFHRLAARAALSAAVGRR